MAIIDGYKVGGVDEPTVADEYNEEREWEVGEFCIYNSTLYKCNTATTGEFDSDSWDVTSCGLEMKGINSNLTELQDARVVYNSSNDGLDVYVDGTKIGNLYCGFLTPSPLVPIMTSNTTPYGEAFGSSVLSGYDYYYAFDGLDQVGGFRDWASNGGTNQYIGYDFTTQKTVKKVTIKNRVASGSDTSAAKNVIVQGSNDKIAWNDIKSYTNTDNTAGGVWNIDCSDNITPYRYHRLFCTNGFVSTTIIINELQFYGR